MTLDKKRFVKLMMLTNSDSDNEALVALRKAQQMMQQEDVTWDELFKLKEESDRARPHEDLRGKFEKMFERCSENVVPESTEKFVTSLYTQFKRKGFLSTKQRECFENIYANFC